MICNTVDASFPERDDLPYSSWTIFKKVGIEDNCFSFEIQNKTFDIPLMKYLNELPI
jgi:hypothetical protein